ncbi:MAG: A/G-specific adenine glycosylase [Sulfuricurvum sp.]|uniref:A/G-specific adenine glycosylase n=1 Tax=Sulfuricurvum sp. TaxID=2025608 RepID=UPI00262C9EDA|nr:A/G-specific adenine glycosylase [Sulfuricurvum sp.]MDD5158431.1 A/G-specific adenine glycosylase [Sulfuricurvum sp.]
MILTPQHSLLRWYEKNGRHDLPWRTTNNPYHIYLSEIMLQQTQVKTVLERFYFPFLERFPTLNDLAKAEVDDVLKMWEGLGYYTRARNLHAAARLCNRELPTTAHELIALPGIGRSTAHAIASFAYKEPLPILDANVKRILHRYFVLKERDEKRLWEYAYTLFDFDHPFEFNQAMMDVGASVCLSKKPLCAFCPFETTCQGKSTPLLYPTPKNKTTKPIRHRNIIVYQRENRYALIQRQTRFLSGLWGFYECEELRNSHIKSLGHITQTYSHFTLEADVYLSLNDMHEEGFEWFSKEEIAQLSLSRADHKVVSLL